MHKAVFSPTAFGDRVHAEIQRRGLSARAAAKEALVSSATLHRVVHGDAPSVETFLRLVKWLACSAEVKIYEQLELPLQPGADTQTTDRSGDYLKRLTEALHI